ncbi:acyl-CoA dehydrogenase family protein [Nocardioides sp. NPDC101246]|uniref:acyl-CoA dehydrogenase family protein n=1 Tax=Nocardioides sp. NPDC101246 TaxID=3364336 RepID=UPI0037F832BA
MGRLIFDEDHADFRESVRRFLAAEVSPHLDEWRSSGGAPAELYRALGEQGFLGTAVPEELGGGGIEDPRFPAVLVEELSGIGALGIAQAVAGHAGVGVPALLRLDPSQERDAWLSTAAAGEGLVVPMNLAGSVARSIPAGRRATCFVALTPGSEEAAVVTGEQAYVTPVALLGGADAGAADVEVAQDAAAYVRLPDALSVRRDLDLWSGVVAAAGARAALALATDYVRERKVFGRPIAEFENTRCRLGELGADLAAAGALVDRALGALADATLDGPTAAAATLVAGRVHDGAVDLGMQLHGGYGYMREYPIAWAFGDARFLRTRAATGREPRHVLADAIGL